MKRRGVAWRERVDHALGYKSDSTKGSAVLDPQTYKRDALIQVWMDSRKVATIFKWLVGNGYQFRFLSEVLNEAIEMLADKLVDQGMVEAVDTTTVARDMLEGYFNVELNPRGKGTRNLLHNKILDDRRATKKYEDSIRARPAMTQEQMDEEDYRAAMNELTRLGTKVLPSKEEFIQRLKEEREFKEREAKKAEDEKKANDEMMAKARRDALRASGQLIDEPKKDEYLEGIMDKEDEQ